MPQGARVRVIALSSLIVVLAIAMVVVYGGGGDDRPTRDLANKAAEIQQAVAGPSTADPASEPQPPPAPGQPQPKSVREMMREGG